MRVLAQGSSGSSGASLNSENTWTKQQTIIPTETVGNALLVQPQIGVKRK